MIEKIEVKLDILLKNKLKLEEYFILFCLVNNDEEILEKYALLTKGIATNNFYNLRDSGFIILKDEVNITLSSIVVTKEGKNLFDTKDKDYFEVLFKELQSTYPKSVKRITGGNRPLHNDLARCRNLYKKTIVSVSGYNIDLHKKILLCVQKYYRDHLKDNKQEFMQLLATFLSQRTWEQYLEDIQTLTELPKENSNYDAI